MIRQLISEKLLRPLILKLVKGKQPRVIYDRSGKKPYLSRYYIRGAPKMADGSSPFNALGNPKPEAIFPEGKWGLYLHRFHASDEGEDLHSHPWKWALSLILVGGYSEERREHVSSFKMREKLQIISTGGKYGVKRRWVTPLSLNFIRGDDFHRVDLNEGYRTEVFTSPGGSGTPDIKADLSWPEVTEAWSLFLVGPRQASWAFWDRKTNKTTPWREFLNEWREKADA